MRTLQARLAKLEDQHKKLAETQKEFTRKHRGHCYVCGCAGAAIAMHAGTAGERAFAALGAG